MKNNKQLIIISVVFAVIVISLFGALSLLRTKTTETNINKESAIKNSKELITNSVSLYKEGDLKEMYFDRDYTHSDLRIQSCLKVSKIFSENFTGISNCYAINNVKNTAPYVMSLILVKPEKVDFVNYEALSNGEQKVTFNVDLYASNTKLKATDSSSDGSVTTSEAKISFKDVFCITDKDGLIIKTNIEDKIKDLSFLWDGTDVLEVEWKEEN